MTAHRKPCYPPTYDENRRDGNCKWCNEPLPRNRDGSVSKSRRWHAECLEIAGPVLMGGQAFARRRLSNRDGWKCADCHDDDRWMELEVDHVIALWSVDRDAPDAWKFWMLANLQLLCVLCHKKKSAREARRRAKEKRIRQRANGERRPRAKIQSQPFWEPPGYVHKIQSRKFARKGAP